MELDFDPDQEDLRDSARTFPAGECPRALVRALAEARGAVDPAETTVVATPRGDGWELTGTKATVFEPTVDGMAVVVARVAGTTGDEGIGAFVVPLAECTVAPIDAIDPSRVL